MRICTSSKIISNIKLEFSHMSSTICDYFGILDGKKIKKLQI